MSRKAAIYHFTDKSTHRPKIYQDQLKALEAYAVSVGLEVAAIYCDMSLINCYHGYIKKRVISAS